MVEFENYSANNNWFGLDSACPAGPLPDILLLRVMTFVPECPHWSLLAMVSCSKPPLLEWHGMCARARTRLRRTYIYYIAATYIYYIAAHV